MVRYQGHLKLKHCQLLYLNFNGLDIFKILQFCRKYPGEHSQTLWHEMTGHNGWEWPSKWTQNYFRLTSIFVHDRRQQCLSNVWTKMFELQDLNLSIQNSNSQFHFCPSFPKTFTRSFRFSQSRSKEYSKKEPNLDFHSYVTGNVNRV